MTRSFLFWRINSKTFHIWPYPSLLCYCSIFVIFLFSIIFLGFNFNFIFLIPIRLHSLFTPIIPLGDVGEPSLHMAQDRTADRQTGYHPASFVQHIRLCCPSYLALLFTDFATSWPCFPLYFCVSFCIYKPCSFVSKEQGKVTPHFLTLKSKSPLKLHSKASLSVWQWLSTLILLFIIISVKSSRSRNTRAILFHIRQHQAHRQHHSRPG